ncbi:MAG: DUF3570 domain-containing protein, partial [Myxococcales bacterium]|nr:DUF3570 domain-containing protein [Myxococcales bacterium]
MHARLPDRQGPLARALTRALLILVLAVVASSSLTSPAARAEDRVTVRGNYYRERSTRVLQPLVTFRKELPDERFALEAEYLLDVISSASIASGALALGGDRVFTEMRHETTARATSKVQDWSGSAFYRYSTETDYTGHTFGFGVGRDLLQRTINVSLSYSANINRVYRITNNIGARTPWLSSGDSNQMQAHYLSLGYSHVLHQRVVGGLNLEGIYARGPQDNPYRRARNGSPEIHPLVRKRLAPSLWMRIAIPEAKMVLEPRYRYYVDDWAIRAHSIEGRVHFRPQRDLQLRLLYRYYTQTQAFFWRDDGVWADEYPYRSDDPKMDDFRSHTIGGRLIWALDGISKFQGLGWLAGAWIEATYNHVFVRCRELSSTCLDQDFGYGTVRST